MDTPIPSPIQINESHPPAVLFKLVNPLMNFLLRSPLHGLVDSRLLLLRWRGRKTGQAYTIPVGYQQAGTTITLFTFSGWQANFREPHPVMVKLNGKWQAGTGVIRGDERKTATFIARAAAEGGQAAYRRFRMEVKGERAPTIDELIPEVRKRKLVLVTITLNA